MKLPFLAPLKLASLFLAVASMQPAPLAARSVIPPGGASIWKYLDSAAGPDAAWMQPGFDDSQWKSGKAPLGFGETRLSTTLESRPLAAWFRLEFDAPELRPGEGLIILLCVDDGAVVYLNGRELGRTNMPDGPVTQATMALRTIAEDDEGFYQRFHIPADALRAGAKNLLAIEVHNISANSSDLYFDLALKTFPAEAKPDVVADAAQVVRTYRAKHYVGPDLKIPDGYIDGGRRMEVDSAGHAASGREILSVDRARDVELGDDLAFARAAELRALPELERVQRLAEWIDRETTPYAGLRLVERSTDELEKDFEGKAILIGDWLDQCHAGVCRHRSLLFKILADEAGLKAALVRGNFMQKNKRRGFAHAWNEVFLSDGRHLLVDVMHNGGNATFRDVTDSYVIEHYHKVDDSPWYGAKAGE
jgi:hypothetical protein